MRSVDLEGGQVLAAIVMGHPKRSVQSFLPYQPGEYLIVG